MNQPAELQQTQAPPVGGLKLAIVIPALNEQDCIADTIGRIPAGLATQIIVADNGSTDATATRAQQAGAEVVGEPRRGYGQACLTGLARLRPEIEVVAFLDADGCDDPAELTRLLAPIARGEADLVLRARTAGDARRYMTPQQKFGNGLACGLIRLGWGKRYADLGPLRVIRRSALERLQMADRTWGWTVEMQIKAVEHGLRICELPVPYRARVAGQSKIAGSIRGSIRAGTKILSTIGRYWVAAQSRRFLWVGLLGLFAGLALMLPHGDFRQPGAAQSFLVAAALAVAGYGLASAGAAKISVRWGWITAIALRLLLLPMYPSDDIWRYLWEGKMLNLGINPYELAPTAPALASWRDQYWPLINNAHLPALYPPGALLVFKVLAGLCYHPLCFKLVFVAADLAVIWLLLRLLPLQAQSQHRVWWYAWNPLVIYSFAGGGHFDSLMLAAGLASLLCWQRARHGWSLVWLGIAAVCKVMFAVLLPFYLWAWRKNWRGWVLAAVLLAAGGLVAHYWWPALTSHGWVEGQKFDQRARLFLAGTVAIFIWCRNRPAAGALGLLGWVLLVSPAFHPWYVTWLLCLAVLVPGKAWWTLSVSAFAYFWVWVRVGQGQPWEFGAPEKWWIWAPVYLVLILEGSKAIWRRIS